MKQKTFFDNPIVRAVIFALAVLVVFAFADNYLGSILGFAMPFLLLGAAWFGSEYVAPGNKVLKVVAIVIAVYLIFGNNGAESMLKSTKDGASVMGKAARVILGGLLYLGTILGLVVYTIILKGRGFDKHALVMAGTAIIFAICSVLAGLAAPLEIGTVVTVTILSFVASYLFAILKCGWNVNPDGFWFTRR